MAPVKPSGPALCDKGEVERATIGLFGLISSTIGYIPMLKWYASVRTTK
jgi:hypothetical protein